MYQTDVLYKPYTFDELLLILNLYGSFMILCIDTFDNRNTAVRICNLKARSAWRNPDSNHYS